MPTPARAAALALLAAACWWAWFAWDRTVTVDPATGTTSGPYSAWQVVGCAVCLIAVTAVAATRLPLRVVVAVVPPAFTAAWSLTAAGADPSGLWAVGAVLVLLGTLAGTALVAATAARVARTVRRPAG